jgi:hypothetical protein
MSLRSLQTHSSFSEESQKDSREDTTLQHSLSSLLISSQPTSSLAYSRQLSRFSLCSLHSQSQL